MAKKKRAVKAPPEPETGILALRKLIVRMQLSGLIFVVVGATMPTFAPFYAEKTWKTLLGFRLPLPKIVILFGGLMLVVSIICFFRSYRCAKCGGLLALTPYKQPTVCHSCGQRVTDKDIKKIG